MDGFRARKPMTSQSPARAKPTGATSEPPLLRDTIGNIAVLTLNRPQARNSLSEAMLDGLSRELDSVARTSAFAPWCSQPTGPLSPPVMTLRN